MSSEKKFGIQTLSIHAGQPPEKTTGAVMTPIYATSTYAQESPGVHKGYEYSRSGNPTRTAVESCIAAIENGKHAFAFASGLAAENAVLDLIGKDAHVIALDDIYGGTYRLFEKVKKLTSGLDVTYVDMKSASSIEKAVRPETKLIWVETPSNPLLKVIDLAMVASVAKKLKLISVCDNTFATPVIQKPLDLGFDIVVHSATKYLNGHSDVVAGVVVVSEDGDLADRVKFLHNATGGILSPFDSFLLMRGIKTLPIRVEAHARNAQKIAQFLEAHTQVERVLYPGLISHPDHVLASRQMKFFGGMITFFIKGGVEESRKFLSALKIFSLAESLGGVESLAEHPAIMTHASIPKEVRAKAGISDNLIRLSVGIEDADDLIDDLENAFSAVKH